MNLEADPAFYSRFEREEEIGKALDHPGILKIIPVEQKSRPYIVMEFVKGQTLDRLMQTVGILPIADTLENRQPPLRRAGIHARPRRDPSRHETRQRHALR